MDYDGNMETIMKLVQIFCIFVTKHKVAFAFKHIIFVPETDAREWHSTNPIDSVKDTLFQTIDSILITKLKHDHTVYSLHKKGRVMKNFDKLYLFSQTKISKLFSQLFNINCILSISIIVSYKQN